MAFPVASEWPQYSGGLIPNLFAARFIAAFYAASVFGAIANTDYEGQVQKMGDKVTIRLTPEIVVDDYIAGQDLVYQTPDDPTVDLLLDKGKYWGIAANAVNIAQSDLDYISAWAIAASNTMKVKIDKSVLAVSYSGAHAANKGLTAGAVSATVNLGATSSPLQLTKVNIVEVITQCGQVLDEQDADDEGRWLLLPSWAIQRLKVSDIKNAQMMGDAISVLRNGLVGMIDKFKIYRSNNIAKGTDGADTVYNCMFGQKIGLTFASQIIINETVDNQKDFGKVHRGLQVFGHKVVKSQAIGHLYVKA